MAGAPARVRLAELVACLSVATDLGMGQPVDYALTTCLVGVRLGEALGFDDRTLHDVYYETLLRYVGCNAETDWMLPASGADPRRCQSLPGLDRGKSPSSGADSGARGGRAAEREDWRQHPRGRDALCRCAVVPRVQTRN